MAAVLKAEDKFDYTEINWRKLGDFENFLYTVFAVDHESEIFDFALKFTSIEPIFLHRHRAHTNTFVVQGDHRIYEPNGSLREIRPVGSFTSSPAAMEPHREGGGESGGIVLYNTRGSHNGVVFDVLNDNEDTVGTLTSSDFVQLFAAQGNVAGA